MKFKRMSRVPKRLCVLVCVCWRALVVIEVVRNVVYAVYSALCKQKSGPSPSEDGVGGWGCQPASQQGNRCLLRPLGNKKWYSPFSATKGVSHHIFLTVCGHVIQMESLS